MDGWIGDIERETLDNDTFRTVVFTGEILQLTVMSIEPGSEIGEETHEGHDQFIRIESGSARVVLGDETHEAGEDWAIVVPSGVRHNVINTGSEPLRLYSLYAPPEHAPGTVHRTKADADAAGS
jgi:mannose-6-phosphate isomerase-like protein (cupin superfamily)